MLRITFTLFLLATLAVGNSQNKPKKRFCLPPELPEVSGLYYAGPDSLWWHNDSGAEPILYLTDRRGKLKQTLPVPAALNRDWEDLTADSQGNLYIGDFGNNRNARRDLCIYIFHPSTGALDSIRFRYPDQEAFPPPPAHASFDMEGFFWHRDSLHLFSKNRIPHGNYYTKHYVLPAQAGNYTAILRDSVYLKKRVVTAAALSPDEDTAVLLAYWYKIFLGFIPITKTSIFLFEDFPGSNFLQGSYRRRRVPQCILPKQYESIDFLNPGRVYIASERVRFLRQRGRVVRLR